jgi:hypothetical protein
MPTTKSLYPNGPAKTMGNSMPNGRPMSTTMDYRAKAKGPDRITAAVAKIPGLSAKQRADAREAFVQLMKGGASRAG